MYCPKCGTQNADNAQVCVSCGQALSEPARPGEPVEIKTSGLAIAAFVLGILSIFTCGLTAIPAIIVGIIALVAMSKSGGRLTGRAFAVIGIVLPVVSVIVILIGLLLPAVNKVGKYATTVKQKAQLTAIDLGLAAFRNDWGDYPPSDALDGMGKPYCGAMKLAEALVGKDLLGFHSNSVFRRDGMDATGRVILYPPDPAAGNLKSRRGPYLQAEYANACRLESIYGAGDVAPFSGETIVLCDVFQRQMASGEKTGMPILYYKANTANNLHDPDVLPTATDNKGNIYNYWDNNALVGLGKPWESDAKSPHNLADPKRFYGNTQDDRMLTPARPYRPDTYILISAGWDNEYGTDDDVFNFESQYHQ